MKQKKTSLRTKLGAFCSLWKLSDEEFHAFMNTYGKLFVDSPESTRDDYEKGVPMEGYAQGSSKELEQYYKVQHLLCTLGSVEKMYMPPVLDIDKSVMDNQILLEEKMAKDLKVGPGDKVLELGCGCGAIAASIASFTGSTMYGQNIEKSQIEKAWKNPSLQKENFTVGDFNKPLPYEDNMFDAVYAIQPMTYVTNLDFTLKEVFRILKPGGVFAVNDVAALDRYDRNNAHHRLMIQHTRELTAFGGLWHYKYWEDAYRNAGFELLKSEGQSAVKMIKREVALYDKYEAIVSLLAKIRLIPRKIFLMIQRMHANCQSYIKAEEEELITLNWYAVMKRPK